MGMLLYADESKEICLNRLVGEMYGVKVVGNKKLLNIPASFDTETTSFIDKQDGEESAIVYVWMFGIGDTVVYGRELDDFVEMIGILNNYLKSEKQKLIVYVHNYKYDFAFIKRYFDWEKIFTKSKRDILFSNLGNIEFRDSLVLAGGRSLAFIGNNLRSKDYRKAVGSMDYSLLRHSETPLTEEELYYCEMDIRVLNQYIKEKIQDDGGIYKIPYTNTGYVRNYVRNACFEKREKYLELIDGLTMTPGCYYQAEQAFMGGAVGGNLKFIGQVKENVTSYDIKSSYPYVMVTDYYPMTYGIPVSNKEAAKLKQKWLDSPTFFDDEYCYQFKLRVYGLMPKPDNDYCFPLSESKCTHSSGLRVNYAMETEDIFDIYRVGSGRVITAMMIETVCTELDFNTYAKFYDLQNAEIYITEMRKYRKGNLPIPIIKSVLKFFHDKTTLDGVEGREAEYMIAKNMLNAIFGMMVEKPIRPDYSYNDGIITENDVNFVEKVEEYNNKYNRFLYYPWGVWVTAHARWRLYDAIAEVGKDFVYCDTDSVKCINAENHADYFNKCNAEAHNKMIALAKWLRVPLSDVLPKSPKGKEKCLGVWEKEWVAKRFKTLGAKRYLVEFENGEMALTVAGTNKEYTLYYLINQQFFHGKEMFENFNENLVIPAEYSKRLISKFIDHERSGWITDYLGNKKYYHALSGIYMEPSAYSFSIAQRTKNAIDWLTTEEDLTGSINK